MRRRRFNALCLLSLVLAIVVGGFMLRGLWRSDHVIARIPLSNTTIVVRHLFGLLHVGLDEYTPGSPRVRHITVSATADEVKLWGYVNEHYTAIPTWTLLALFSSLPGYRLIAAALPARPTEGHCPRCGYDLRGTPGAACPECAAGVA